MITCNLVPFAFLQPSNECSTAQDVCFSDHKSKFDGSIKVSKVSQFMSSFIHSFIRSFVHSSIHSIKDIHSWCGPFLNGHSLRVSNVPLTRCLRFWAPVLLVVHMSPSGSSEVSPKKRTARWENGRI